MAELGGQIVHGVHGRARLHRRGSVQKGPAAVLYQLDQNDLEEHLGKLLAHAHARSSSEGDVVEPGAVLQTFRHETLGLEFFFVREDVCHVVRVADAVDDVPAFGDLVTLENED